jgi:hypothetical protein
MYPYITEAENQQLQLQNTCHKYQTNQISTHKTLSDHKTSLKKD